MKVGDREDREKGTEHHMSELKFYSHDLPLGNFIGVSRF